MIKAVVFDLDDTLISERQYIISGFKVISSEISNKYFVNKEEIFKTMVMLFEESSKGVFNRLLDNLKVSYSKDYILQLIKLYREHTPEIEFFKDVIPTLNILRNKGISLGIITDGYKETQRQKVEVLKCKDIFEQIIITDELGREFWKPHEKPYKLMADKLKVDIKDIVYLGDNEIKDFITANKLGIKTICINRENKVYKIKNNDDNYKAKYYINDLNSIFEYLS